MYPAKPGFTIGFHGCDHVVKRRVVSGVTTLIPSNNTYDWLGNGIYFWENNQQRALDFATEQKQRKGKKARIRRPAAIAAVLDTGFCLDLLNAEYIKLLKDSYETFFDICQFLGVWMPSNRSVANSTEILLRE